MRSILAFKKQHFKKNIFTLFGILFFMASINAQDLTSINKDRQKLSREGMTFLTSWAATNIAGGTTAYFLAKDPEWKYFHEMNVYWNTVNLGLGISGLLMERKSKADLNMDQSLKAQKRVERIFLVNSGLDLIYIGSGLAMRQLQNAKNPERMKGYGNALILQGSFLLLFDGVEYFLHRSNGYRYKTSKLSFNFDGNSVGLSYNFSK
jgi:hypothetical protein